MIESIMYFLLLFQIFFLLDELLIRHVHILSPIWLNLIALGIVAVFGLIIFVARFSKLLTFILIILMDFTIAHYTIFVNLIPFAALYLYIIGLLQERGILNEKIAILTSPIIAFGFLPVFSNGVLENSLWKKIHTFLYSTGNFSLSNPAVNQINSQVANNADKAHIVRKVMPEVAKKLPGFQSFIIFLVLLLAVSIGILFLAKFYQTEGKKTFYKTLVAGLFGIAVVISVASFVFFKFIHAVRLAVEEAARSSNVPPIVNGNKAPAIGSKISVKEVLSKLNSQSLSHLLNNLGLMLGILTIIGGAVLFYIVYRTFFVEDIKTTLISKKETKKFIENIRRKGITQSLSEIKNREEYVRFFYFSIIYLLQKKKIQILKYETPNEFYIRVQRIIEGALPYFDFLTLLFNKVKYGDSKVSDREFNFLERHSEELIESAKKVTLKEKKGKESGRDIV